MKRRSSDVTQAIAIVRQPHARVSALLLELGLDPRVILSGRGINDGMAGWVATSASSA